MTGNDSPNAGFRLGPDGPDVGRLGIGTWAWGDRMVWGYGQGYSMPDLHTAFDITLKAGIRFYDTAEIYGFGKSEQMLGEFIRDADADVYVTTKCFPYPWRLASRRVVINALRRSLERLGLSQVDLYLIHWPSPLQRIESLMDGLADAVEAGLTQTVGISNFNAEQTQRAYDALKRRGIPLAANQSHYSLLHRQPERNGLLDLCRDLGVTFVAYSPIEMGVLTGKYTPENPPTGSRSRRYSRQYLNDVQPLLGVMRQIGEAHGGKKPAQVALNWVIAQGAIPIPGAKNARQAEENVDAITWSLTNDEVAALDAASTNL